VISWTDIATSIDQPQYTDNWQIDFDNLMEGVTNYVSVRVYDNVNFVTSQNDIFFVKKDVTPPVITDNQTGDDTVYSADPGSVFDVDFTDSGGSLLDYAEYTIYASTGQSGGVVKAWAPIASGIDSASYTGNWSIDFGTCLEGYNYVSVRVYDVAGSSDVETDAFYVRKAGGLPIVTDNQPGDDTWRTSNDGLYNVDFSSNSALNSLHSRLKRPHNRMREVRYVMTGGVLQV